MYQWKYITTSVTISNSIFSSGLSVSTIGQYNTISLTNVTFTNISRSSSEIDGILYVMSYGNHSTVNLTNVTIHGNSVE